MNANLIAGRKLLGIFAACAAASAAIAGPPGVTNGKPAGSMSGSAVHAANGRSANSAAPVVGKTMPTPSTGNRTMPGTIPSTGNKPLPFPTSGNKPTPNTGNKPLPFPTSGNKTVPTSTGNKTVPNSTGNKTVPNSGPYKGSTNGQQTGKHGQSGQVGSWMQKPSHGQPNKVFSSHCNTNYCYQYGTKKSFGYCYEGYNHNHWYCRSWSNANSCWMFYDASCTSWYYWCQPAGCYYPCSYKPYGDYCCTAATYAEPVCTTPVCEPVATYSTTTPIDVTSRYLVTTRSQVAAYASAPTPVFAAPKPVYNGQPQPVYGGQPQPVSGGQPQPVAGGPSQGLPGPIPPMPGEAQ